jgi:hypothetical protein
MDAFNLISLPGVVISTNANMSHGGVQTLYFGKTVAQGATGDGTVTIDLGQQYQISHIGTSFELNDNWPGGGKVDVDDGSGNWTTVFDSGRGNLFGLPATGLQPGGIDNGTAQISAVPRMQTIDFSTRSVRYIRFTDYFVPGVGTSVGRILNWEVF